MFNKFFRLLMMLCLLLPLANCAAFADTLTAEKKGDNLVLSNQVLSKAGENFLKKQIGKFFPAKSLEITLLGAPPSLQVPEVKVECDFQIKETDLARDIIPLKATVVSGKDFKRNLKIYYRWGAKIEVLVSSRSIRRGEALNSETVATEIRTVRGMGKFFRAIKEMDGMEADRYISAGLILAPEMIRKTAKVRKGQVVMASYLINGLQITSAATAMEDGNPNQQIRLRLISTERVLNGTVREDGSIIIAPQETGAKLLNVI